MAVEGTILYNYVRVPCFTIYFALQEVTLHILKTQAMVIITMILIVTSQFSSIGDPMTDLPKGMYIMFICNLAEYNNNIICILISCPQSTWMS